MTVASSLPPGGGGQGEGAARSGPQPVAVPIEIQEIAVHVVDMPLVRTFRTAHGTTTAKQTLIVRAQDADGVVGWGEAPASDLPLYSPDTLEASWYALTKLLFSAKPTLVAAHPEALHLDQRAALDTFPLRLHPGAARYYREAKP